MCHKMYFIRIFDTKKKVVTFSRFFVINNNNNNNNNNLYLPSVVFIASGAEQTTETNDSNILNITLLRIPTGMAINIGYLLLLFVLSLSYTIWLIYASSSLIQNFLVVSLGYLLEPRRISSFFLQGNMGRFLVGVRFHDYCWVRK